MDTAPTPALMKEINAAFNSRDVDRIMTFFAEDCTFLKARGPEAVGRRVHVGAFVLRFATVGAAFVAGCRDLVEGLVAGARNMIGIGVATAAAGIIVGTVSLTGIGLVMTEVVELLSGGNLMAMLILVALLSLVLGLGLSYEEAADRCHCAPGTMKSRVNRARQKGYALLFAKRIFFRPIQTFKLLRTLGRHMQFTDILKLLSSPFRRRTLNRKPELPAKMIDLGLSAPVRDGAPVPVGVPDQKYVKASRSHLNAMQAEEHGSLSDDHEAVPELAAGKR